MSKLNLEGLNQIAGYVGVALVDSDSGMAMATLGGGNLNLEVAAAGNSDVLRSKRRVADQLSLDDSIEDVLISLGKQYHIIRPSARQEGVFIYLVMDRARANLAMARRKTQDADKEMMF